MIRIIVKVFKYVEPMWLGNDSKFSIRRFLSLLFALDLVKNFHHIVMNWEAGKSYADAALLLGIEAGLIAALLSLTTYSSVMNKSSHSIEE
jgi:hypothetical protein